MARSELIRVLYLQPAAQFGGAERQAATLVPVLRGLGVDVVPYVGPGRAITEWMEERGVDDYVFSSQLPGAWAPARGIARATLPWRYARALARCRREIAQLVQDHAIDVVFACMAFSWVAATPVARALDVPIVWRAGGTECSPFQRRVLAAWTRWHQPDVLVCNGDAVRQLYGPIIGAPAVTIRNGVDGDQFHVGAGDRQRLRPRGAKVVVGFAARLVPQKRPEDFIRVAARFAGRRDVAFLLAGEGSRRAQYAELARRAGADTVELLGYVADMRDFYAACDVLVLPSRSEGCPNVVLEAMAMKTAVIAADLPATREIIRSDVDGVLYPIGDLDRLERVLARLIDQPTDRRMLVERAHQRVHQELSACSCANQTARLLRAIVGARGSSRAPATTPARLRRG